MLTHSWAWASPRVGTGSVPPSVPSRQHSPSLGRTSAAAVCHVPGEGHGLPQGRSRGNPPAAWGGTAAAHSSAPVTCLCRSHHPLTFGDSSVPCARSESRGRGGAEGEREDKQTKMLRDPGKGPPSAALRVHDAPRQASPGAASTTDSTATYQGPTARVTAGLPAPHAAHRCVSGPEVLDTPDSRDVRTHSTLEQAAGPGECPLHEHLLSHAPRGPALTCRQIPRSSRWD